MPSLPTWATVPWAAFWSRWSGSFPPALPTSMLSWSSLVVVYNPLFVTPHNPIEKWLIVVYNKRRHFRTTTFSILGQLMRHPLIELSHLYNLLQMLNNRRMVDGEFWDNFSFNQLWWWLSVSHHHCPMAGHCAPHLQGSHLLCKTPWTTTALYIC